MKWFKLFEDSLPKLHIKTSSKDYYTIFENDVCIGAMNITNNIDTATKNSFYNIDGEKYHFDDHDWFLREIEIDNLYKGKNYGIESLHMVMEQLNISKLYLWAKDEHKLWNRICTKTPFYMEHPHLGKFTLFIYYN